MAELNKTPGSSTSKQRQLLHQIKRRHGWTDDDLHDAIGVASTTALSAADASAQISRLGSVELANPPGQAPRPYAGRKATPGATRMIVYDHTEQITRLLGECFPNRVAGMAWLKKNFGVDHPRGLLTAKRAGQVIRVLKEMIARPVSEDEGSDAVASNDKAGVL